MPIITNIGLYLPVITCEGVRAGSAWAGHYLLSQREGSMHATGMALLALYFVAVTYAVIYIEGQIGQI